MEQRGASHNARNRLPHPAPETVHELVQACKELDDNEMNRQARPRSPVLTPAEAGRELPAGVEATRNVDDPDTTATIDNRFRGRSVILTRPRW